MPIITAEAFDRAVVEALAVGQSIEGAVLEGRQQVLRVLGERSLDQHAWQATDRPDWSIPVLFSKPVADPWLCRVPGGDYLVGLNAEASKRQFASFGLSMSKKSVIGPWVRQQQQISVPAFQIGRWPVTNHQYRYYLERQSADVRLPRGFERRGDMVFLDGLEPSAPVVDVTWEEAMAYCRWRGGRLPTADEWEAAARGMNGHAFPWGDRFDPDRCSAVGNGSPGPEPVFARPSGASSFGIEDLCGNVFEWTATEVGGPRGPSRLVVVGGSWDSDPAFSLPSLRSPRNAKKPSHNVGFRCAF